MDSAEWNVRITVRSARDFLRKSKRGAPFPARPVVLILCRGLVLVLGTLRAAGLAVRAGGGRLLVCAAADSDREDCGDNDDDVFHGLVLGCGWLCCAGDSADAGRGVSVRLAFKARRDGAAGRFFGERAGDGTW